MRLTAEDMRNRAAQCREDGLPKVAAYYESKASAAAATDSQLLANLATAWDRRMAARAAPATDAPLTTAQRLAVKYRDYFNRSMPGFRDFLHASIELDASMQRNANGELWTFADGSMLLITGNGVCLPKGALARIWTRKTAI